MGTRDIAAQQRLMAAAVLALGVNRTSESVNDHPNLEKCMPLQGRKGKRARKQSCVGVPQMLNTAESGGLARTTHKVKARQPVRLW
jgi:uncharacterized paraquat-inducible protein A